jgi:hypothetical protein
MATLLQVVDALTPVALAHLLAHEARHHALDPLLAYDGVLGGLESGLVIVVDTVEGRWYLWLLGEEEGGLRGWHLVGDFVSDWWGGGAGSIGCRCRGEVGSLRSEVRGELRAWHAAGRSRGYLEYLKS